MSFLNAMLPVLVAAVIVPVFDLLQAWFAKLDALPAWTKQILVAAGSWGVVALAGLWGVQLSTHDILGINQQDVSALLTFGLTQLFHSKAQST